jgi:hypothetical protein
MQQQAYLSYAGLSRGGLGDIPGLASPDLTGGMISEGDFATEDHSRRLLGSRYTYAVRF